MTAARFAISMDPRLAAEVRKAAGKEPVSAWLADAAERKLRAEGLMRVVREWEAEYGELGERELAVAARRQRPRKRK
jgi:hypothetical protein